MSEMWMDVDTALAEVPVNIFPLTDDTDFKAIEESVAYNAAGMELIWHFTTTGGATSATVVTPTTGGVYDWAHQDGGLYTIEIPASGGASANNDTEGFGHFTGKATGVLPWRGPVIGFRAAALNNALIDGGDVLDVSVTEISGDSTAADNAEAFFDGTGYAGTNNVIPTVTTVTNLHASAATAAELAKVPKSDSNVTWNATALASVNAECDTAISDASLATAANLAVVDGIVDDILIDTGTTLDTLIKDIPTVAEFEARTIAAADYTVVSDLPVPPTVGAIADQVWDEALSGHLGAGTTGTALNAAGSAGDPWSTSLPGAYGAGSAGKIIGDNINATISSRSTLTAQNVWEYATRTLSSFGTLVADVATAVWGAAERTLSAFAFTVTVGTNNDKTGYTASTVSDKTGYSLATAPPTAAQVRAEIDSNSTQLIAIKAKTDNLPGGIPKNAALSNFPFLMVLTSDHYTGATGKTVTAEISKDGAAFAACANSPAELSGGVYTIDFAQAEMNADLVTMKFSEADCDTRIITIKTDA